MLNLGVVQKSTHTAHTVAAMDIGFETVSLHLAFCFFD
jgi:hypothetical protein